MQSLPAGYRALLLGASAAIGGALAAQLRDDPYCAKMLTLGRSTTPAVDFDAPPSIAEAAHSLFTQGPWNLVLVATGMLQGPTGKPEKRLTDLSAEHMAASFAVNTIGPALALAHFPPQLAHGGRPLCRPVSQDSSSFGAGATTAARAKHGDFSISLWSRPMAAAVHRADAASAREGRNP